MKRNKKRIVVALGGNALGNTPAQQLKQVREAAGIIADLAGEGHELIISHGNGPQVGIINSAMNYAAQCGPRTPYMPSPSAGQCPRVLSATTSSRPSSRACKGGGSARRWSAL